MRAPILKQGRILIASVQGSMSDADLLQLRQELLADVRRHRVTGVVIDITQIDVMDSFAARTLRGITEAVRLLGAEAVVVGIQPEVAFAMVQLGLTLEGTIVALDLEEGLAVLQDVDAQGSDG